MSAKYTDDDLGDINVVSEKIRKKVSYIHKCTANPTLWSRIPPFFRMPGSRRLWWRLAVVDTWMFSGERPPPRPRGRPKKSGPSGGGKR